MDGADTRIVNAPQPVLPGPRRGQLYGRYVIRFKADPVPGYKTAWLLWPDSGDRDEGEIDFPEGNLDGTISAFTHERVTRRLDAYPTTARYTRWHTAVVDWLPNRITYRLDGRLVGSSSTGVPDTPMHYVIQTETQLSGGAPADTASGHVYIDWVAIYARS